MKQRRPTRTDDEACERIVALAETLYRVLLCGDPTVNQLEALVALTAPNVGDVVVVTHTHRQPARDRVGVLERIESKDLPDLAKVRGSCSTRWTIRTPRGKRIRWVNCMVLRVPIDRSPDEVLEAAPSELGL